MTGGPSALAEGRCEPRLSVPWIAAIALALTTAWVLLFLPQLLHGQGFVAGDSTLYGAYSDFSAARWAAHRERTFWNPYVFLGLPAVPSLADSRPQWLPDPLLSAWDAVTRGPRGWPLGPVLLVHLLGMVCVTALARRLWRCGPGPAAFAGLLWGYAPGIVVPLAFGHQAQAMATGLIPAVLLAGDAVLTSGTRRSALAHALGLSAAVGLLLLAGHPQFACYGLVALAAFTLVRGREAGGSWSLPLLGAATALGFAMAAVLWWPALLYLGITERANPAFAAGRAAPFSLALRDLLALGWPHAVGWGGSGYWGGQRATDYANTLGLVGLGFALWGVAAGIAGRQSRTVRGLSAVAAGASLLALGPNLPWLGQRLMELPLLSVFRTPSTWMVLLQLVGALIAGLGLERALDRARTHGVRMRLVAGAILALATSIAFARPALEDGWRQTAQRVLKQPDPASWMAGPDVPERPLETAARRAANDLLLHLSLLGIALGVASFASCPGHPVVALVSAVTLVAADLGSLVVPVTRDAGGVRAPPPPPALAYVAAADPLHRAYPLDTPLLFSNDWIHWRARHVAGNATVPALWIDLKRHELLVSDPFVRAIAVRYVSGAEFVLQDSSGYDRVARGVLARRDALPRAYAVPRVEVFDSDRSVLETMRRSRFDPSQIACTTDRAAAGTYPGSARAVVTWRQDEPDVIALQVETAAPAFVVVADTWAPGWNATVDGAEATIVRVNHALRGVPVPRGDHRIEMRYRPPGWDGARAVTLVAWGVWGAAGMALALTPRRRRPTPTGSPAPSASPLPGL